MTQEALVADLAGALRPVRRHSAIRDLALLFGLTAAEVAMVFVARMERPDLGPAMASAVFWWKLLSLALLAMLGLMIAVASTAPDRAARRGIVWLTSALAAALATGIWLGLTHAAHGPAVDHIDWRHGLRCVSYIVVLSLPIAAALAMMLRRGAATDHAATAVAAGAGAAGSGAFAFVFACPADDPLYILLWYAVGCGIVTALSRLALPRVMRW